MLIINKSKTAAIIVAALLMTSITTMTMQVKPAKAQLAATQPVSGPLPAGATVDTDLITRSFLSFRPNPIGVGQSLLVNMWLNPALASNNRYLPKAFVVTITKPDGTKDVKTLDSEAATAAAWFEYTPEAPGSWTIKFDFLGTYYPAGRYYNGYIVTNSSGQLFTLSCYYEPSSTAEQKLTVQQDYVWSWPPAPLPTDYWTRPASLDNREWWPILGNWPGTGYVGGDPTWDALYPNTNPHDSPHYYFNPWVQGPNSAHVVWKRQGAIAGLIGGSAGIYGITSDPGSPAVIYSGRAYQTYTKQGVGSVAACYDLRTGEVYYEIPTAQGGVTPTYIAYIPPTAATSGAPGELGSVLASSGWSVELLTISGSRLMKINPFSGAVTGNYSIAPLTGGTYYMNRYFLTLQTLGNATNRIYRLINWTTQGSSATLAGRIISNISWPWFASPVAYTAGSGGISVPDFNVGIAGFVSRVVEPASGAYYNTNISAASLRTGEVLWNKSLPGVSTYQTFATVADHGKLAFLTQEGYWLAYDLYTGQLAWKSEVMDYPWGAPSFGAYSTQSAYGMLFRQSYDGVYAFDWDTGKIVWHYKAPAPAHFESPYIDNGTEMYSFNSGGIIADGKMYVENSEHSQSWPMTRGWGLHCINITTGELIWKINNPVTPGAIADSYLAGSNSWDGYLYVYGKGKSATTVTAPDVNVPLGTGFTIKGTVLDMSPAQPGTACVSKQSMTQQMEYLHLSMPIGGLWNNETITGVPVALTAIGSDGTYIDLGTATTNGYSGAFTLAWTPPKEGTYEIIASFAGDDSYGSSMSTTGVSVGPAPAEVVIPEQPVPPDYTMTIIYAAIAIIIAVAIAVAIAALLILRKR